MADDLTLWENDGACRKEEEDKEDGVGRVEALCDVARFGDTKGKHNKQGCLLATPWLWLQQYHLLNITDIIFLATHEAMEPWTGFRDSTKS